jgi:hypothetical protein
VTAYLDVIQGQYFLLHVFMVMASSVLFFVVIVDKFFLKTLGAETLSCCKVVKLWCYFLFVHISINSLLY